MLLAIKDVLIRALPNQTETDVQQPGTLYVHVFILAVTVLLYM